MKKKEKSFTVACLEVYVELISWTAAALVAFRQVCTDVFTAMIHDSTHILSYRVATWREIPQSSTVKSGELKL